MVLAAGGGYPRSKSARSRFKNWDLPMSSSLGVNLAEEAEITRLVGVWRPVIA